eukprot:s4286_g2.t1
MSPSEEDVEDPWIQNDPWRTYVNENAANWSSDSPRTSSSQTSALASEDQGGWRGQWRNWDDGSDEQASNYSRQYDWGGNWSQRSSWSSTSSEYDGRGRWTSEWNPNWSYRSQRDPWEAYAWDERYVPEREDRLLSRGQDQRSGDCQVPDQGVCAGDGEQLQPMSPQARASDPLNRPSGQVPSGIPSVAGNASGNQSVAGAAGSSKVSSSYPPIFNARPGESWVQYWRTVTFWMASEGKALPVEMRGPRLMQQLRERAGKIVQHLSVEQVAAEGGLELIRTTMERSPIIKLLDQKKIDQRRQKFMKLAR